MMRLPGFRYRAARTVADAAAWLAEDPTDTMLLAGGTDLLPNMKRRQQTPGTLIALRGIEALREVSNGDGLSIGSGVTLSRLVADPRVADGYRGLWQAAAQVATPHLRNMGTIGGNLCLDTVAQGDRLLHEEGRTHLLGRDVQPAVPGGVVDRHGARAAGARRLRDPGVGTGRARLAGRRTVRQRRHALPDAGAG
jgi:hypothetical protein